MLGNDGLELLTITLMDEETELFSSHASTQSDADHRFYSHRPHPAYTSTTLIWASVMRSARVGTPTTIIVITNSTTKTKYKFSHTHSTLLQSSRTITIA